MKQSKFSILDNESGEILGNYQPKKPRRSGHKYILVFGMNLFESDIIISPLEMAILMQMDTLNKLYIPPKLKELIRAKRKKSLKTINNTITRMIDKDLMLRIGTSHYFVNPLYFTKSHQNKTLELQSEYLRASKLSELERKEAQKSRKPKKRKTLKVVNFQSDIKLSDEDYEL